MDKVIRSSITGRAVQYLTEDGIYNAITGERVAIIVNGAIISPITGKSMNVVNNIDNGSVDLSFITADAGDILFGKVGSDASGNPIYGNIPTVAASKDGNTITVPAGFHAESNIFKIEGTDTGACDFYRCASVNGNSWSGYKGSFVDGNWIFSTELTSGLAINAIIPEPGFIYNADASVKILSINIDPRLNDAYCYYDLSSRPDDVTLLYQNESSFTKVDNLPCMRGPDGNGSDPKRSYYLIDKNSKFGSPSFTVAFWFKNTYPGTMNDDPLFGCSFHGSSNYGISCSVTKYGSSGVRLHSGNPGYFSTIEYAGNYAENSQPIFNKTLWNHYAFVYNHLTGECVSYINGVPGEISYCKDDFNRSNVVSLPEADLCFGIFGSYAYMSDLVVSRTAMTDEQIKHLAWKSREVTRPIPAISVEEEKVYTVTLGDYVEGSVQPSANFGGGEDGGLTIELVPSNVPSWMDEFSTYYDSYWGEGGYFYGTPDAPGEYIIPVVCRISDKKQQELFSGTYYEETGVAPKTCTVKIIVTE